MRHRSVLLVPMLLIACSPGPQRTTEKLETFDVEEPVPAPMGNAPSRTTTGPRIAYSYSVTYDFDQRTVATVQGQQLALCRKLGPAHCLVMTS